MRYNVPKSCAALLCRACEDFPACVAEHYLTLRTGCSRGRTPKVVRPQQRKNPLPFPLFAAVTCRQSAPDSPRERGDSQEGGNRRCLPSCAPARRQRKLSARLCPCRAGKISSLRKRHSAVLHQNAKEEHCCLAVSLFAHITGFCFPDFSAVRHWPHGGALLRSPEALSPALQRTRVSPGRYAYARDSRSYPRTDRAFLADD